MEKTREEELLCARAAELVRAAEYTVRTLPFLTPRERLLVHDSLCYAGLCDRAFWWGGAVGCERSMGVFLPDWVLPDTPPVPRAGFDGAFAPERETFLAGILQNDPALAEEIPLRALRITGSGFASLTHRDFLGSIMALGVERSVMGDIWVEENAATVFAQQNIIGYLTESLTKIGRDAVKCTPIQPDPTAEIQRRYESVTVTAASPRIDGVVHALTGVSREDAAEMIRRGLVERNYMPAADGDRHVEPGDILSIRGWGKCRIQRTDEETKRGRRRIVCWKYV